MSTSKELKEVLSKVDKTVIEFSVPVLERIKLECLSFIGDMFIPSLNGKEVIVGGYSYKLGVTNCYHHLSVGRALFKLIKANPELGKVVDEKHLSVRMIGEEVARLAGYYKDQAYLAASKAGYGFESLRFHRIADLSVDVEILVEAIMFIKVKDPLLNIEIYSQEEMTKKIRLELAAVQATEAAQAAKNPVAPASAPVAASPEIAVPNRRDPKYDGLFGEQEYEADVKDYELKTGKKVPEYKPLDHECSVSGVEDDTVDVEDADVEEEDADDKEE